MKQSSGNLQWSDHTAYGRACLWLLVLGLLLPSLSSAGQIKPNRQEVIFVSYNGTTDPVYQRLSSTGSIRSSAGDKDTQVPLGSLWKLFTYAYLIDHEIEMSPYACHGDHADEVFCCRPGMSVDMDSALARSCGLFFQPARTVIDDQQWHDYWVAKVKQPYPWLLNQQLLGPGQWVALSELLQALHSIDGVARIKLQSVLARVVIDGTAKGEMRYLGSMLRAKTFTWDTPQGEEKLIGGAAGWLNDGSVVWLAGAGNSAKVLQRWSKPLARLLERKLVNSSSACVKVHFFDRYPLAQVLSLPSRRTAKPGVLTGRYEAKFVNGNTHVFETNSDISLLTSDDGLHLQGVFNLNDYVARVLDREISPTQPETAKAFAITARSYLLQNAHSGEGCFDIADSSRYQRVSINPPSELARKWSYWTDGLVLQDVPMIRYHLDKDEPDILSWEKAQLQELSGLYFDQILKTAFPAGKIGVMNSTTHDACEPQPELENWLQQLAAKWHVRLMNQTGYEMPGPITLCRIANSNPYSELDNNRVFIGAIRNEEDRISLIHEYLHLAFKYHPRGVDEAFIESTARELAIIQ